MARRREREALPSRFCLGDSAHLVWLLNFGFGVLKDGKRVGFDPRSPFVVGLVSYVLPVAAAAERK
jgi:hypothetical protein